MRTGIKLLAAAFCFAAVSAHADIYGYIDADGVAHVATEQVDGRCQLFMRGNASFDSDQLSSALPAMQPATPDSPLMKSGSD